MKSSIPKLVASFFVVLAVSVGCATGNGKPEIVWFFACSDVCPEPTEQYMVQVYEGVEDPAECVELGGIPATLVGWGTRNYCKASTDAGRIDPADK